MSDSEDYMSDKVLQQCTQRDDVRPGLLFKQSEKRAFEAYKHQQESLKKPKQREQEQERRDEGLKTSLPSTNKGFKMLEKMGYTPGTGLGKASVGIKEPVLIMVKSNSSGFGREQHILDIKKQKVYVKERRIEACENQFKTTRHEKFYAIHLRNDIFKGQKLCENLDMKQGAKFPENAKFWQKGTIADIKKKNRKKLTDTVEEGENTSSDSSDAEDDQDGEQLLKDIIMYLRTTYKYCIYCGDYFDDESECPGAFRIDHE